MEPEVSLWSQQNPAIGPHLEPFKFISGFHIPFLSYQF